MLEGGGIAESGRFQALIARPDGLFALQFAEEARWQASHAGGPD